MTGHPFSLNIFYACVNLVVIAFGFVTIEIVRVCINPPGELKRSQFVQIFRSDLSKIDQYNFFKRTYGETGLYFLRSPECGVVLVA